MDIDTPNVLSRETTFLMGILKKVLYCNPHQWLPRMTSKLIQVSLILFQIQFQVIQDIQFCPQKEYFAIQFCQWKRFFKKISVIQFCPWKFNLKWIVQASNRWQNREKLLSLQTQAPIAIHFPLKICHWHRKRWKQHMQMSSKVLENSQEILTRWNWNQMQSQWSTDLEEYLYTSKMYSMRKLNDW